MSNFQVSVQRFNEYAEEYASRFMSVEAYKDSIDKFCDSSVSDNPEIIELACGPGNVTKYLRQRFPQSRILAVDLAPRMIELARKQLPDVDFRVMDVRETVNLSQQFDLIMCSFCLPFLSGADTSQLIRDCFKMLKTNGLLYLSTMEGTEKDAGYETTSFSGNAAIYFNYHTYEDISRSLLDVGFTLQYFKRQDYTEPDGTLLTDMIFVAGKNNA